MLLLKDLLSVRLGRRTFRKCIVGHGSAQFLSLSRCLFKTGITTGKVDEILCRMYHERFSSPKVANFFIRDATKG